MVDHAPRHLGPQLASGSEKETAAIYLYLSEGYDRRVLDGNGRHRA